MDEPETLARVLFSSDRGRLPLATKTPSSGPPALSATAQAIQHRRQQQQDRQREQAALLSWEAAEGQFGPRYARCTFDSFKVRSPLQQDVLSLLQEFTRNLPDNHRSGGGLVLFGPRGTGKDHLAMACLRRAALTHWLTIAWCDGQSLFGRMRDRIGANLDEASEIQRLTTPTILLISDPLPQDSALTDYQQGVLWRIVDRRYRDLKPTWLTVNCKDGTDMSHRLGGQLADRLIDGALVLSTVGWPSFRSRVN